MDYTSIFIVLLVLVILFLVIKYVFSDSTTTSLEDASTQSTISASSLEQTSSVNSAYSLWFYITDWNENYGNNKVLLTRLDGSSDGLKVSLGTYENKMDIDIDYYDTTSSGKITHTCTVYNVPIQKAEIKNIKDDSQFNNALLKQIYNYTSGQIFVVTDYPVAKKNFLIKINNE